MTNRTAYRSGYLASKRTRTYDLDAAEARFATNHDLCSLDPQMDEFTRGWCDYAAGYEYDPSGANFPVAANVQVSDR